MVAASGNTAGVHRIALGRIDESDRSSLKKLAVARSLDRAARCGNRGFGLLALGSSCCKGRRFGAAQLDDALLVGVNACITEHAI